VLLSICETCECKGASFLNFLRSGEMDVNAFFKRPERRKEPKARFLVSDTKPLQQEMIAIRIPSDGVTANSFWQRDGMICVGMLKAG